MIAALMAAGGGTTALVVSGWLVALAGLAAAWSGADRARRVGRLAAQASHEVRGPLTAAQLALDGLTLRGEVDASRTLALDLQLRRARRALDDLALGVPVDRPEPVPLAVLASELETAWRPVAVARGRRLRVDPAPAVAGAVIADRVRLAQAAGNLVANALDHGAGDVRVAVGTTRAGARVTVSDDGPGPGCPLGELLARRRHPPGIPLPPHGHGLRVSADVAARAGGRLTASGSAFTLELPLAEELR